MTTEKTPASPSRAYEAGQADRILIRDITGGLPTMVSKREAYLPKWPVETEENYKARLMSAVWTPLFDDILFGLTSKPFAKEVALVDGASERVKGWCEDVDGEGNNLHVFAQKFFHMAVRDGRAAILVDYPDGEAPMTQAEEEASGRRPYFVLVDDASLIALYSRREAGRDVIDHARIKECNVERDGWSEKEVERIRVLEPGVWSLYRKEERAAGIVAPDRWTEEANGTTVPLTYVPLVVLELADGPPLIQIARMQTRLYRAENKLETIFDRSAYPMLSANRMVPPADNTPLMVGPGAILYGGPDGDWSVIEPAGTTIQQHRDSIDDLKNEMRRLGMQPLMPGTGDITATATGVEAAKAHSAVQQWALHLKDSLENALRIMGDWVGEQAEAEVYVHTDFGVELTGSSDDQTILTLQERKLISRKATLEEMKRRGRLAADYDPDEDAEQIEEERDMMEELMPAPPPLPGADPNADPEADPEDDPEDDAEDEDIAA